MSDEQGNLYAKTMWHKGHIEGELVYYHPNGKRKMQGTITNGKRSGKWTWWDESGKVEKEEVY